MGASKLGMTLTVVLGLRDNNSKFSQTVMKNEVIYIINNMNFFSIIISFTEIKLYNARS